MSDEFIRAGWASPAGPLGGEIGVMGLRLLNFDTSDCKWSPDVRVERVALDDSAGKAVADEQIDGKQCEILTATEQWLNNYFAGIASQTHPNLDWLGVPEFHRKVYDWVLKLPFGARASYGEVARAVGCPGGARAVGQAMNRNPIVLIIPCHRVLATGNKLGGFGGGLELKRELLEHEAEKTFFSLS